MTLPECKCCGKCCHIVIDDIDYPCKYLIFNDDGTTKCKIYHRRLGTRMIAKGNPKSKIKFYCSIRVHSKWDYEDCPYNTDKDIRLIRGIDKIK